MIKRIKKIISYDKEDTDDNMVKRIKKIIISYDKRIKMIIVMVKRIKKM